MIDTVSILIDTVSIQYRYSIDTVSIQYRYCIDTVSILYRYCIDTVSIQYRYLLYRYSIDTVLLQQYCRNSMLQQYCCNSTVALVLLQQYCCNSLYIYLYIYGALWGPRVPIYGTHGSRGLGSWDSGTRDLGSRDSGTRDLGSRDLGTWEPRGAWEPMGGPAGREPKINQNLVLDQNQITELVVSSCTLCTDAQKSNEHLYKSIFPSKNMLGTHPKHAQIIPT